MNNITAKINERVRELKKRKSISLGIEIANNNPTDVVTFDDAHYSIDISTTMIEKWSRDRNIIPGSTTKDQFLKLTEEVGELSSAIAKQDKAEFRDAIGDVFVCLVNIAALGDVKLSECIRDAYNEIKDRKGQMVDGIFIKE